VGGPREKAGIPPPFGLGIVGNLIVCRESSSRWKTGGKSFKLLMNF